MFVKKPRSSEAYEGDTVIIMCDVIGDPKPEVVWLRDFLKVRKLNLFVCLVLEPPRRRFAMPVKIAMWR
jgi:hypothetical protein